MCHGFDVFVGGINASAGEARKGKMRDGKGIEGVQGGMHMP